MGNSQVDVILSQSTSFLPSLLV